MAVRDSLRIFKYARKAMVGGVSSPVRSFLSVGTHPLIMERGQGQIVYDVDGNPYVHYSLSWGALILGHAQRDVVSAVKKAVDSGTSFGTTTRPEVELAQLIVKYVPSIEMLRFVNSGTEATMSAIRLARGFTKRNMLLKFDGCYHGHFDDLLIHAGSGVAGLKESSSLGITKGHIQDTLSLPFNDIKIFEETLERYKDDMACVIIEPVAGNMGVVPAEEKFLKAVRALTKKYKIVLIFDEVMTGFRTNLGGVQADLRIIPDLTCLGKIIGGGFPIGAFGGRKDIMAFLAPRGEVYQAGTFSGNPIVMAAGLATLKNLNRPLYENLNLKGKRFTEGLNSYFRQQHIDCGISHYGSMLSLRFKNSPVFNYVEALGASSKKIYRQLFKRLLSKRIYLPPAELETFFISSVHSDKDSENLSTVIKEFMQE